MSNEELMTEEQWRARLEQTTKLSDIDERQAKIDRISSDPKPQWQPEPKRAYETTEKHYIVCVDAEKANVSLPDASTLYNEPHKFGAFLVSDRKELPDGWFKTPPRGTSVEAIKDAQPALYTFMKEKKIENF